MDEPAAVRIASGPTSAAFVPELAMVGSSFRHEGQELLAFPHTLAEYGDGGLATGIPLLFPWANRLGGTSYPGPTGTVHLEPERSNLQFNGPLPIHGLLPRLLAFSTVSAGPDVLEAELDAAAGPAITAAFPFPHRIRVRAEVAPAALTIATTVTATGDVPVPISFGYHPYVRLSGSPRDGWRLRLSARRRLLLDDRMIPTGASEPVSIDGLELAGTSLDDGFTNLGPEPELAVWDGRHRITVRLEQGYPYAQVYAPPGRELIALEPMTAPTDALRSGTGLRHAAPGESFTARFSIVVEDAG